MALTFADTHNMITFLTKLDASEVFDQIVDFLNAHVIQYALMVNPTIYVSCIKQFWTSVSIKKSNDVVRLQALIDRKKVIITENTIRQAFRLDDADGVDTLLFDGMLVPQQVQDVVEAATENENDDNKVSTEPTPPLPTPATLPPSSIQEHIPSPPQAESTQPSSPPQQQSLQTAKISMTLLNILLETCATLTTKFANLEQDKVTQAIKITKLKKRVRRLEKKRQFKTSGLTRLRKVRTTQRVESSADTIMDDQEDASKHGGGIAELDADKDVTPVDDEEEMDANVQERLAESQAKVYHMDLAHAEKVLSMQDTDEAEPAEVEEVIKVVTAAKLMTEVVTTATTITAVQVPKASALRKRRGVVIQDPEEDEAFARELEAELNANINWSDEIDQVKRKEKQDNTVMRYQALKRKPVTEAQARKNMMIYLKNMVGFKMDFFKGGDEITKQEKGSKRKDASPEQRAA
nr:hypothetical protein [Tanacetum cinerariifolium]